MRKKSGRNITFEGYWKSHINGPIKRRFTYVVKRGEKEIIEFRKSWGIPEDGFKSKRDFGKWRREQKEEFNKAPSYVSRQFGIVDIFTEGFKVVPPETLTPRKSNLISHRVGERFDYFFEQEVAKLAHKIGMDTTWLYPFRKYVLGDEVDMSLFQSTGVRLAQMVYTITAGPEIDRKLCLIFGPNTRLEDIKLIWKRQVEPILKTLPGYIKHPPRKSKAKKGKTP